MTCMSLTVWGPVTPWFDDESRANPWLMVIPMFQRSEKYEETNAGAMVLEERNHGERSETTDNMECES